MTLGDELRVKALRSESMMELGDYPAAGKSYWTTLGAVMALGFVGLGLLLAVH